MGALNHFRLDRIVGFPENVGFVSCGLQAFFGTAQCLATS